MACFGTRPEVIKLAPVIHALVREDDLAVTTVTTAQHREMLDQMLETFAIVPDRDLDLMRPGQSLVDLTARAVTELHAAMLEHQPDAVLVQGDTTTAMCAALAAFYAGIPVGHVEAGLRTGDVRSPFPEEVNRRLVAPLARWHYCPTDKSAANLLREGINPEAIVVTGNTVIDALLAAAAKPLTLTQRRRLPPKRASRRILVTLHRRETQGAQQAALCRMLARVAERPDVEIIFPVHLSPAVRQSVMTELTGGRVQLLEPLEYHVFAHVLATSDLIVTDSGGLPEEAPALDIPVLVMRDTTERPEGVAAGCARLCGTTPAHVEQDILELLDDIGTYHRMAAAASPYGTAPPQAASSLTCASNSFCQPGAARTAVARAPGSGRNRMCTVGSLFHHGAHERFEWLEEARRTGQQASDLRERTPPHVTKSAMQRADHRAAVGIQRPTESDPCGW